MVQFDSHSKPHSFVPTLGNKTVRIGVEIFLAQFIMWNVFYTYMCEYAEVYIQIYMCKYINIVEKICANML